MVMGLKLHEQLAVSTTDNNVGLKMSQWLNMTIFAQHQ